MFSLLFFFRGLSLRLLFNFLIIIALIRVNCDDESGRSAIAFLVVNGGYSLNF